FLPCRLRAADAWRGAKDFSQRQVFRGVPGACGGKRCPLRLFSAAVSFPVVRWQHVGNGWVPERRAFRRGTGLGAAYHRSLRPHRMKRLVLGGGVALAALLVSVPEASAWGRLHFGIGFNFGFDIGGWGCRGCHGQAVDGISEGYPSYAGAADSSQYPSNHAS